MRNALSAILAPLVICAFAGVIPAAAGGNSGDANGMREQAQIHPNEANENPDYVPGFVAEGEAYPSSVVMTSGHFVRSPGDYTALAPLSSNCHTYQVSYGGYWYTACGPQ